MPKASNSLTIISIKGGQKAGPLKPETLARIARGVAAMKKAQLSPAQG